MEPLEDKPKWRRKTEPERRRGELALHLRRLNPVGPLVATGAGMLLAVVLSIPLIRSSSEDWKNLIEFEAVAMIIMGLFTGFLVFVMQILGMISLPKRLRLGICNKCFKFAIDGKKDYCDCGGMFEDADGWTLNCCPKCGYDLRASGKRCPECGTSLLPAMSPDQKS